MVACEYEQQLASPFHKFKINFPVENQNNLYEVF